MQSEEAHSLRPTPTELNACSAANSLKNSNVSNFAIVREKVVIGAICGYECGLIWSFTKINCSFSSAGQAQKQKI